MKRIELSKETNEIQRVLALRHSRNKRHRYQEFLLEGPLAIDEALKKGWKIRSFFYAKGRPLSRWAQNHLAQGPYEIAYAIPQALMEKISDKTEPAELIAIAAMQPLSYKDLDFPKGAVILVLDEPKSAGNVGTIIRSAVAFGVHALILSGHSADEYDPKCIRSSVGTFFSLPIYRVEGVQKFQDLLNVLKMKRSVRIIATGDRGSDPLEKADFQSDVLFLVLGNETTGISAGYRQLADQFVKIPLKGPFTSLNIGAAASIFLYEIFRSADRNK